MPTTLQLRLVAAAFITRKDKKFLITQRPDHKSMAGLWEFPGGKVEVGETVEEALIRELQEELNLKVNISELKPLNFATHSYPDFNLLMPLFHIHIPDCHPAPAENQEIAWVNWDTIYNYKLLPADIPLLNSIKNLATSVD
jgi:8-oxo-dGTP diphosphatase